MDSRRYSANKFYRNAAGFSLISMVMGLCLGLLVIELGLQCFCISHRQWCITRQGLLADRNSRSLLLTVGQDLKACGYRGLRPFDAHYPVKDNLKQPIPAVRGLTAANATAILDTAWQARLDPDSDLLVLSDIPVGHWAVTVLGKNQIRLSEDSVAFQPATPNKQRSLIADTQGATWCMASLDSAHKRIVLQGEIHSQQGKEAIFSPVEQVSYFVARSQCDPKKRYALWRRVTGQASEELLQGIRAFKLDYRLLVSDLCEASYASAASISDWSQVCRVRIRWRDEEKSKSSSIEMGLGHV